MDLTAKEAVEKLLGRMQSVADQVGAETGKREALQTQVREIRDHIERYSRQLPMLGGRGGGGERDPDWGGFWPNAERAASFGRLVLAGTHHNGDTRRRCAEGFVRSGLAITTTKGETVSGDAFVKAMGESSDVLGGYFVTDALSDQIIRHVETFGVARKYLTKAPMSSERQSWPRRTGGFTVYYPDEGQAPTASDLSLGRVNLTAKKWALLTFYSRELDEDSVIALGELIAMEFALALAQAEDTNCFMGDGTSTYAGITGVFGSANVTTVTMAATKTGFEDIDHDELVRLKYAVPAWCRRLPDCGYFMHSGVAGICERMLDGVGRPMYQQPTEGHPLRIAGFPVREVQVLPDTDESAISTKFIAFGSLFAWGILGQRRGMTIETSREVRFLEGEIAVMAVPRQDIQEATGEAMAVLQTAAA